MKKASTKKAAASAASEAEGPPPAAKPPAKARSSRKKAVQPVIVSAAPSITVIAARADIGFGNQLYLRGSGPGLDWDIGVPMVCATDDLWTHDVIGAEAPVTFKFLINDQNWSTGPDYFIEPGAQLEVTPRFG